MKVSSNGILIKEGKASDDGITLKAKDAGWIIADGEGLIPRAEKADAIIKKATGGSYEMKLLPQAAPTFPKEQKKIVFVKFLDKTDKKGPMTYFVKDGVTMVATSVTAFSDNAKTTSKINERLVGAGFAAYNEEEVLAVGKAKNFDPELGIVGEVIDYATITKGTPGFKTSVVVRWVIFDMSEEKIVYRFISGGYCDQGRGTTAEEAFQTAAAHAVWGLMTDSEFLALCSGGTGGPDISSGNFSFPLVSLPAYADYSAMIEGSIKSAVTIKTSTGHGSGFIISEDGYVLTNHHVIADSGRIDVIFNNGLKLRATVVSKNKSRDIALLKISGEGFTPMPIDMSEQPARVGTDVVAIGTPENLNLKQTVTKGIVSGIRRLNDQNFIQTDVSINSGNSGGALLSRTGAVIGIVTAKIKGDNTEGLGFAIPVREALSVLNITLK